MKLTKNEIKQIVKDYDLGEMKSFAELKGGWVNFNHEVKTSKGNFVLRVLGKKWDAKKRERIKLEFMILEHLNKSSFPYAAPLPLKDKKDKYVQKIRNSYFWIYEKIPGKHILKLNNSRIKELAKALALYHKAVKKIKYGKNFDVNFPRLEKSFKDIKNIKPKNKLDRFMLKNIDFFVEMLNKSKNLKFNKNILPTHSDFHRTNLLWKGEKIIGIIDFDNLAMAPRIRDIAHFTKSTLFDKKKLNKKQFELFIKEYNKIAPLTKKEKEMILPFLIKYNCHYVDLFYNLDGKKTAMKDKLFLEEWMNDTMRGAAKNTKWIKN